MQEIRPAKGPLPQVRIKVTEDDYEINSKVNVRLSASVMELLKELFAYMNNTEKNSMIVFEGRYNMKKSSDVAHFATVVMSYIVASSKIQQVYEEDDFTERLKAIESMLKEINTRCKLFGGATSEYSKDYIKKADDWITKEMFELLQKKLGQNKNDQEILEAKYRRSLEGKTLPEHIQETFNTELERLKLFDERGDLQFNIAKSYLDWLTALPYGVRTQDHFDLEYARSRLDETFFGLDKVKERIVEFVAVCSLKGSCYGKVLCFVGPPGVGKTSIGKAIADALKRKFYRISLGGVDDVRQLRGHRRTYVGAMPGSFINALKITQVENPVILLDEIDKMGVSQGSPEDVLLEILDSQTNSSYSDHYIEAPIDFSKVLFICTANSTAPMSSSLLDRLEVIRVEGYTEDDKRTIFKQYLLPKLAEDTGVSAHTDQFSVSDEALDDLLRFYCRDPGVRSLEKKTREIFEKIAKNFIEGNDTRVTRDNLRKFVGPRDFSSKRLYDELPIGVAVNLGFGSSGGNINYIEVLETAQPSKKEDSRVKATGNLEEVAAESVQIAVVYAKRLAASLHNTALNTSSLHLNFTSGGQKKFESSAGVSITSALLSFALQVKVPAGLVFTGELTLNGYVLAVTHVKDRVMAAAREGMMKIVMPAANQRDWDDLSSELKSKLEAVFVDHYSQVLPIAFPELQLAKS
jgi:Lon-like ATP-dependent protease